MQKLILLLKSKVALAIIGTVLFGSLGAFSASFPFSSVFHGAQKPSASLQAQAGLASIGAATATPMASATSTPTPRPATPTPAGGQLLDLHGTVSSTNPGAGSFIIRQSNGATTTVMVTSNTTFQGDARSVSGLQPGWHVDVKGLFQANGTFTASLVNADNGT